MGYDVTTGITCIKTAWSYAVKESDTVARMDTKCLDELPENFITHELLDLDADSPAEVMQFMESWGLLFSPLRFNLYGSINSTYEEDLAAVAETNELNAKNTADDQIRISIHEACITAKRLQSAVIGLISAVTTGQSKTHSVSILSAAACNPNTLAFTAECEGESMTLALYTGLTCLSNMICNQAIDMVMDDEYEWATCQTCGRHYKRMRHDKRPTKTDKRSPNAPRNCSDTCADKAKGKRREANRKTRKAKPAQ